MKLKVRNAISVLWMFMLILVCFILPLSIYAQDNDTSQELSCGQYEFLTDVFGKYSDKQGVFYYQPKNPKLWINEFLTFKSDNGIGTCMFNDESLVKAIEDLQKEDFSTKSFEKNKLPKRLKPLKESREKSGLHISEPLIIDSYCFLFIWDSSYQAVEIYQYEKDEPWQFKCYAVLIGEL